MNYKYILERLRRTAGLVGVGGGQMINTETGKRIGGFKTLLKPSDVDLRRSQRAKNILQKIAGSNSTERFLSIEERNDGGKLSMNDQFAKFVDESMGIDDFLDGVDSLS